MVLQYNSSFKFLPTAKNGLTGPLRLDEDEDEDDEYELLSIINKFKVGTKIYFKYYAKSFNLRI